MPAGLVLEGAGGPRGPAGEEGLRRPPAPAAELGSACSCRAAPAQPAALPAAPGEAARKTPGGLQAASRAAETSDSQWLFFAFQHLR